MPPSAKKTLFLDLPSVVAPCLGRGVFHRSDVRKRFPKPAF